VPIPNSASATFTAQAEPDAVDFDIISAATNGYGILSGCACTPASSGSTLGVAVAAGVVWVASTPATVASGTVTPGAAHASLGRFDLVAVNASGTKSVVAGTAAATPVFPAIPASSTILCAVWIPATATSITAGNIVDKRQMLVLRRSRQVTSVSADYTVLDTDDVVLVDDSVASRAITLPTAVGRLTREFQVLKTSFSSNYVRIIPNGTQTINGAPSYTINEQWDSVTMVSDGANWIVV
jgi:hypothetical protein